MLMKFYHNELTFEVPKSVYYPREDSLLLAKTIEKTNLKSKAVLEVGCGCGFLSVLMAKSGATVSAVDINPEAVEITKANADANGAVLNAINSDLFSNVRGTFDLIVFNPPYLPVEEGEHDAAYAGGPTGREVIGKFIAQVKSHLRLNGYVLVLISSLTGEKEVIKLFNKEKMSATAVAREKVPWEELIVIRAGLLLS